VNEVAGTFLPEWIRDGGAEAEDREATDGSEQKLRARAARRRRHRDDDLLGRATAEGSEETGHERVDVCGGHVDVGGALLRAHRRIGFLGWTAGANHGRSQ
jgi:hypothetical protein